MSNKYQLIILISLSIMIFFSIVIFAGDVKTGGVLKIGKPVNPPSLDPQRDAGGPSSEIQESIFETLVKFDYNMNLVPGLAESWVISEDGKEYTFKLRENVVFHDGGPFNAEVVKFVFERSMGKIDEKKNRYLSVYSSRNCHQ